jgi:SAM-dependent methyltransferase
VERLLERRHFKRVVMIGQRSPKLESLLRGYADDVETHSAASVPVGLTTEHLRSQERPLCDLVMMVGVIQALPDPSSMYQEVTRMLEPGGYALICVPHRSRVLKGVGHLLHKSHGQAADVTNRSQAGVPEAVSSASQDAEATAENGAQNEIFINHNPKVVIRQLAQHGLKVERILSVSHLHIPGLNKVVPKRVMLAIEGILRPAVARSPIGMALLSVYLLVRKQS